MSDREEASGPDAAPPIFTEDGRHVIRGHNDGKFRAPSTRAFGLVLILAGLFFAFSREERWTSPFLILAGVLILVFARYVRHVMFPDCWYIAEDDRKE